MAENKEKMVELNKGQAKEEMFLPFMIAFAFFGGIALSIYFWAGRNLQWVGAIFDILGLIVLSFFLYFYRDPKRKIIAKSNELICPADGKVVGIEKVDGAPGLKGKYTRISIYLNAFNVHIQRMPIAGKISGITELPGRFLPAFHKDAGTKNSQNIFLIKGDITAVVKQIAGVLVHRPISWVDVGDELKAGDRFGMITFGSRVELFVPVTCEISVTEDEIVYGGTSILGHYNVVAGKSKKKSK